jgi:D-alanine-D-alanine ligase
MERNTILLFGGDSSERLVSFASAQMMAPALSPERLWFWHKNNAVYELTMAELNAHKNPFTEEFNCLSKPLFNTIEDAIKSDLAKRSTFVLGLHGGRGENGFIQSLLEESGIAFTGSNAKSSHIAFNKLLTKVALAEFNIKMAPHVLIEAKSAQEIKNIIDEFMLQHKSAVLKPLCSGSSIDTFFLKNQHDSLKVAESLARLDKAFLCEEMLFGRELTVGVIERSTGPIALPATEIIVAEACDFDYDGKYLGKGSKEITPAQISENISREAQRMAIAAHVALGLEGYSRADMIYTNKGLYFLETNTLPGLSKQSLVTQQLAAAHISMREFLLEQIQHAKKRAQL